MFTQYLNGHKTLKENSHARVKKETSDSTEIARQIRQTKRLADSTNCPINTNLQSDFLQEKYSPNDIEMYDGLDIGYVITTRDTGVRTVFMRGF